MGSPGKVSKKEILDASRKILKIISKRESRLFSGWKGGFRDLGDTEQI